MTRAKSVSSETIFLKSFSKKININPKVTKVEALHFLQMHFLKRVHQAFGRCKEVMVIFTSRAAFKVEKEPKHYKEPSGAEALAL